MRDTPLTAAVRDAIADDARRRDLHEEVARLTTHMDDVIGRWAAVMLSTDMYAAVIDRHVELASNITWLNGVLDKAEPPDDYHRQRRARSSPAVQIEGTISRDALADRVVVIAQLAEELDPITLQLAMRLVPVAWWQQRLGASAIDPAPARLTVIRPHGPADDAVPMGARPRAARRRVSAGLRVRMRRRAARR